MAKPVILCVDDEKIVLDSLKEQIKRHFGSEYSIETFENGEDALDILEECLEAKHDIPVIISDQIMPGVKGDELLIKVHQRSPETLKILLTGQAGIEAVGNAVNAANLYRYIAKPWEQKDLMLTLKKAISSYFQAQQLESKKQELERAHQQLETKNQELQKMVGDLEEARGRILKINQIVKEVSSTLELQQVSSKFIEKVVQTIREDGSGSILLYNEENNSFVFYASYGLDPQFVKAFAIISSPNTLYSYEVVDSQKGKIFDFEKLKSFQNEETAKLHYSRQYIQQLIAPMLAQNKVIGLVTVSNYSQETLFTERDLHSLENLTQNLASHFENSQLYAHVMELNRVYERYVPQDFVKLLNKGSILDVELGDQIEKTMTILFSDIRSFTTLSEKLTPEENFLFINSYLSKMGPLVRKYNGFIDKFIGDSIMALFDTNAENAVHAAINMLQLLDEYNQGRQRAGYQAIKIGIGINTGSMMLGTLGDHERMEGTVISDAVNLASRLEGMTKLYGVSLLIGEETYNQLNNPHAFALRFVDRVQAKGKHEPVSIFEIYDGDPPEIFDHKDATKHLLEEGFSLYREQKFADAQACFEQCLNPRIDDKVVQIYLKRCQQYQGGSLKQDWDGVERLESKR